MAALAAELVALGQQGLTDAQYHDLATECDCTEAEARALVEGARRDGWLGPLIFGQIIDCWPGKISLLRHLLGEYSRIQVGDAVLVTGKQGTAPKRGTVVGFWGGSYVKVRYGNGKHKTLPRTRVTLAE